MKSFLFAAGIATGLLIAWVTPASEWIGAIIGRSLGLL
jgi:hypothetical protein